MVDTNRITLQLNAIHKSYNVGLANEIEVLHGINLTLKRGEFVALVGQSGSGKSTLLNQIGLLEKPTSGEIFIIGQATEKLQDRERTLLRAKAIGFVFQSHHLLPEFTAIENVMLPLLAARGRPNKTMRLRAAELIEQVGLTHVANHMSNNLSGGEQQRVAIARALVNQPALVLADEPTGNLDTQSSDNVFNLLRNVNESSDTSFLIVTHDLRLAQRCDRIIELVDGKIETDKANIVNLL